MTVRAKFRCTSDTHTPGFGNGPQHEYRFSPIYQADVPEDQRYAKATPSGEVRLLVDNPAVVFEVGAYYYLDFTKVEEG